MAYSNGGVSNGTTMVQLREAQSTLTIRIRHHDRPVLVDGATPER